MQQVKSGDLVRVHYTGKLTTGEQFDSSEGRDPLEFTVGAGQMIRGFDAAMPGMEIGQKKTVHILAEDAYGPRREEMVISFPIDQVPPEMKPQLVTGMQLSLSSPDGMPFEVVVTHISDDAITLDANNFLAGKDLVFDIELVSIS